MSLTKRLGLIVGAAASINGAMAQTAMDQSRAYQNELFSDASRQVSQRAAAAFTAKVGGYEQFRYTINQRDDSNMNNDYATGFSNARTRINISGNICNEDWGYFIQFGFSDETSVAAPASTLTPPGPSPTVSTFPSGAGLEDAYGTYKIGNGWDLKWGQFKAPFLREELVGDTQQLAMDRSVTNQAFTAGRSQGIQVGFSQDAFRINAAFTDGVRTANTDFVSPVESDFALTARGEWKWAGAWSQADDGFTSWQNSNFFGMVGAAAHYQGGGSSFNTAASAPPAPAADPADFTIMGFTADVTVKGSGWNAFAAFITTWVDPGAESFGVIGYPGNGTPGGGAGTATQNDMGLVLQGGIFVAPQWELFGRLDYIMPDSSRTVAGGPELDKDFGSIALGANYYLCPDSQAAKFTAQFQYFFSEQAMGIAPASTLSGLLGSQEDGQFTISAQMQLVF